VGSIHSDVKALEGGHTRASVSVLKEEPPVPLTEDIIEELTAWQTVLRHVRRAGDRGLSCLEFERETSRGHGAASAAFHSAERKGFIRRDGRFRGGYAVYVRTLP
jgi:hypothetical protein